MIKRDFSEDLAICNAAAENSCTECGWTFIAEARTGWPHAIERALAAEAEVERLSGNLSALFDALTGMLTLIPGALGADEQAAIDRIRADIYQEEATASEQR